MRFRGIFSFSVAIVAVLVVSTFASAAIIGSATLIKSPPVTPFANPDAALSAPWVSYRLSVASDAGEIIQAVEANISGQLHQRWNDIDFDGDPTNNPSANSANQTQGDSHLLAATGSLFGSGPSEDNPGTGSPLPNVDPSSQIYGVGSYLRGAWALTGGAVGTSANVAYIVVPAGSELNLDINVKLADPTGATLGVLDGCSFFACEPQNLPPIVDDGPILDPIHVMLDTNNPPAPTVAMYQFIAQDDQPLDQLTWSVESFDYLGTGSNTGAAPTIDANGKLSWAADGWAGGDYKATVKATDAGGLSDTGMVVFSLWVPEPSSLALLGLALVGFAGFRRK